MNQQKREMEALVRAAETRKTRITQRIHQVRGEERERFYQIGCSVEPLSKDTLELREPILIGHLFFSLRTVQSLHHINITVYLTKVHVFRIPLSMIYMM